MSVQPPVPRHSATSLGDASRLHTCDTRFVIPPVSKRRRHGWVTNVLQFVTSLRPGTLEAVTALILVLPFLLFLPRYAHNPVALALELLVCVAAGTFGRWPTASGCVVGAGLTVLAALTTLVFEPSTDPRWSSFATIIPIVSAGARGLKELRRFLALWYWAVLAIIEMGVPINLVELLNGVLLWGFIIALFWLMGDALRSVAADRQRMERDHVAAVRSQRRTIARDLHDTIAYSTTSIILRAEQAKLRGLPDDELVADLDYIIAAGRRSMRDLRGMMETLRRNEPEGAGEAPHSPWQISSLEEVIERRLADLDENGFRASAHIEADLAALPESVRETLAKVVSEATANMMKHGDRSAPCSILIESGDGEVEAVFINTPSPATARATLGVRGQTNHLGLVGARERVEALGGECDVTSTSPTWVLRARIPIGA